MQVVTQDAMKTRSFTAVAHKEQNIWVAECPEAGTMSQGYTLEEAVENLKEATELNLEEFSVPDVGRSLVTTFEVQSV